MAGKPGQAGCCCGPPKYPYDCEGYSFCGRGVYSAEMEAIATVSVAHTGLGGNNGITLTPAHRNEYNPIQGKTFRYLYWESGLDYVGIVNGEAAYRKIVVLGVNCKLGTDIQYYRADGSRFALGGCNNTFVGPWQCFDANNQPSPTGCHARRTQQDTNCVVATTHVYLGDCGQGGGGGYAQMMPPAERRAALGLPPKEMLGAGGEDEVDYQPPAPILSLAEPFRAAGLLTPGKIRVGIVCPDLHQGGAEAHQLDLMAETSSRFDWVGLVCTSPESEANEAMLAATSKLVPVQFGKGKIAALAAACDVLVTWSVEDWPQWMGGANTPLIFIDHFPHDSPYPTITQWCLRSVAKIVGVSELTLPGVPDAWRSKSLVCWNGVDEDRLAPKRSRSIMRALWGVPANARVAGFYARRSLEKRPDAMIRMAAALPADWHIVLVGESRPYPDEAEALALQIAGLPPAFAKRIHLLPPDPAAGDVLNAFDVCVNPAEVESFGLTMCEALWMGVPVVATPAGMAKLNPQLVYPVRLDASGAELAAATLKASAGGPRPDSQLFAKLRFSQVRFATEWAAIISATAGRLLPLPGILSQAGNFIGSMATHIGAGGGSASDEVQADRLAICQRCPLYVPKDDRCSSCGCYGRAKRALPTSSCPEGKWGPVI